MKTKPLQAVILAGGRGTRLAPYTTVLPKPLMPIGEYPILEVVLRQLKAHGVDRVVMAVGYLAGLLEAYCGDGSRWGLEIRYAHEREPLGTAGPLAALRDQLDETFLMMNGDILTDLDYADLLAFHRTGGAAVTIATYPKPVPISLGVLELNERRELTAYIEKPTLHYEVSMGIYAVERRALSHIPTATRFDFPDLIHALLAADEKVLGYPFTGSWLDIGRPEDHAQAVEEFDRLRDRFLPGESGAAR